MAKKRDERSVIRRIELGHQTEAARRERGQGSTKRKSPLDGQPVADLQAKALETQARRETEKRARFLDLRKELQARRRLKMTRALRTRGKPLRTVPGVTLAPDEFRLVLEALSRAAKVRCS